MSDRNPHKEDRAPDGETGRESTTAASEPDEQFAQPRTDPDQIDSNPSRLGETDEDEERFDAG